MRDVVHASPAVADLRERLRSVPEAAGYYDRIRLGEMVAGEVARRRDEDARLALDVLDPLSVAVREEQPTHPNAAFNLAFLVRRDGQAEFTKGVAALGEQ